MCRTCCSQIKNWLLLCLLVIVLVILIATMRQDRLISWEKVIKLIVEIHPWTSGEQFSACLRIYFLIYWSEEQKGSEEQVDLQGQHPQSTEWLMLTCRKLIRQGRRRAQIKRAQLSASAGKKCEGGEGKDELPEKTTEMLLMRAGLEIRKQKLSRRWHSQDMWSEVFWKHVGKGKAKTQRIDLIQFYILKFKGDPSVSSHWMGGCSEGKAGLVSDVHTHMTRQRVQPAKWTIPIRYEKKLFTVSVVKHWSELHRDSVKSRSLETAKT